MEHWIQRILLATLASTSVNAIAQSESTVTDTDISNEIFELGMFAGIINIGDFGSEWAYGVSAVFQASEDFFLQYNYLRTDVDESSYELSQGNYFSGDDRAYSHYDLLVGYKIFQGEMYPSEGKAYLSSLYIVGGVGDTQFGGEESFTYTIGAGYQIALSRNYLIRFDYRNYIYDSNLIRAEETTTQSALFSAGLNYLF